MIAGTANRDLVFAFAGNDRISTDRGRDVVYAGKGNDTVDGGPGLDRIYGGPGDDTLSAGPRPGGDLGRRDFLWGGFGVDTEKGGASNDVLHALAPDNKVDSLDCGPGDHDVAWLRAGEHDTTVNCEVVKTVSFGSDG